jgi:hypothetical protein
LNGGSLLDHLSGPLATDLDDSQAKLTATEQSFEAVAEEHASSSMTVEENVR